MLLLGEELLLPALLLGQLSGSSSNESSSSAFAGGRIAAVVATARAAANRKFSFVSISRFKELAMLRLVVMGGTTHRQSSNSTAMRSCGCWQELWVAMLSCGRWEKLWGVVVRVSLPQRCRCWKQLDWE